MLPLLYLGLPNIGVSAYLILLQDKLSSRNFMSLSNFSIFSIWLLLRFSISSLEHFSKFSMYYRTEN